jgi:hypothetical protein
MKRREYDDIIEKQDKEIEILRKKEKLLLSKMADAGELLWIIDEIKVLIEYSI